MITTTTKEKQWRVRDDMTERLLTSTVAGLERYLNKTWQNWAGTEEEYREWARETAKGALKKIAEEIAVIR